MKKEINWTKLVGIVCSAWIDIYVLMSIVYTTIHPEVGLWRVPLLAGAFVPWNIVMIKSLFGDWGK